MDILACGKIWMDIGSEGLVSWDRGSFVQCVLKEKMSSLKESEVSQGQREEGQQRQGSMEAHRYLCEQVKGKWDPTKRLKRCSER